MDLGAYAQIDDLSKIMEDNGIDIPRLRGLRLMKNEKPVSDEELKELAKKDGLLRCEELCRSCPPFNWNSCVSELSDRTDAIVEYYCVLPTCENVVISHMDPIDIRWVESTVRNAKRSNTLSNKQRREFISNMSYGISTRADLMCFIFTVGLVLVTGTTTRAGRLSNPSLGF